LPPDGELPPSLRELGWRPELEASFAQYASEGLVPARVAVHHGHLARIVGEHGLALAELSGRLLSHELAPPVSGDWVAVLPPLGGRTAVRAILPRLTALSRRAPGAATREQVLAANVDVVLVVVPLDRPLEPATLERYLATAWDSGAEVLVVLTKADLADDPEADRLEVEGICLGVPVLLSSAVDGRGIDVLVGTVAGRTGVLVGPSGAGKSTLLNAACGAEVARTRSVRRDGTGRHTTTWRELIPVLGGGLVIDTPGLRELQLWSVESGVQATFADVEELAERCRFHDCAHESEPGCAVREAVERGTLAPERLRSWQKLERELHRLDLRQDRREFTAERMRVFKTRQAERRRRR
jgi:ribosome biogenesis GTPase / thiamine phosphate phosphatase